MDLRLYGHKVLVTGGSQGIGLGIARAFAREGARVCIVSRNEEALARAASLIREECGAQVLTHVEDTGSASAAERLAARFPDIDILVNNAGNIPGGSLEEVSDHAWRAAWDVKVYGYINLSRAYLPLMKAANGGVIVNVIGAAGESLDANYIAGSVGNAALMAFTKTLGSVSTDHGVRVVGVNPGPVATDRLERIARGRAQQRLGSEERWREVLSAFPLGRAAEVEEIANAVMWLASPVSAYTSGTVLTIDAGASYRKSIA
ncbi:short-chain dehydrogenase/reductase [Pigmentiphaga humi]|uniref:short-chain dehydrogenase/reductase n=1 Tax=Pigmentiphaga humi TaxID=2478468 RepID=UPI000F52250B|nr:short-chain dehydrogenase/reductase [Pigmentiphaga humi]